MDIRTEYEDTKNYGRMSEEKLQETCASEFQALAEFAKQFGATGFVVMLTKCNNETDQVENHVAMCGDPGRVKGAFILSVPTILGGINHMQIEKTLAIQLGDGK